MAASAKIIMSPAFANPVKFVPVSYVQSASYHTKNYDATLFREQFMSFENSSNYAQKYEKADITALQFHANSTGTFTLQLIDCGGRVYETYQSFDDSLPDNFITRDGLEYQLYTRTFGVNFADITTPKRTGIYYLLLTIQYDTATGGGFEEIEQFISEPILIAQTHQNTILIEAKHNRIQYNTIFRDWAFRMRVEGYIDYDTPDSVDTQYNDEYFNIRLLNSYTYRKFKLSIGGANGVPTYIIDKLNILFGCKLVKVDSSFYTKDEGAKFAITRGDKRAYATLELREQNNYYDQTFAYTYFDSDAQKFLDAIKAAGGSYLESHIPHLNRLVQDLKGVPNSDYATVSVWADLVAFYPMFGLDGPAHKFNLKNPLDTDAAFRLNFVNNPTHTNGVVAWNGTNQYANTFVQPAMMNINSAHMAYYTLTPDASGKTLMGANAVNAYFRMARYNNGEYYDINDNSGSLVAIAEYSKGHKLLSRTDNSNVLVYQEGLLVATLPYPSTATNTRTVYIGANNDGIAIDHTTQNCLAAHIGAGLSAAKVKSITNALHYFKWKTGVETSFTPIL